MKKILTLLICAMLVFCTACNGGGNNSESENTSTSASDSVTDWRDKEMLTVEEILETYSKSSLKCDQYNLSKYMKEVWSSQIIYNETAMFFRDKDGTIADKTMIYDIAKVLEVRDNTLKTLYVEGKDYSVVNGKLHWLEGSDIFVMDYDDYYLDEPNDPNAPFASERLPGKYYYYAEGDYFAKKQVSVTYIRTEKWNGPEIDYSETKLPKTREKLKNKENITIVYYGDSVMEGCNASGFVNAEPHMPMLSKLITRRLSSYYGYDGTTEITEFNTAVGGWTTNEGVREFQQRVLNNKPDLVLLKFGGNDGTLQMPPNTYGNNLKTMMRRVLSQNPDAEFILLSGGMHNADAKNAKEGWNMRGNVAEFEPILEALSEEDNVALANLYRLDEFVLSRKDWVDITGNNISHPTDFLIRLYAQLVCSYLCPLK